MIEDGERIAQMVVARHEHAEWQEVRCWTKRNVVQVALDIPEKSKRKQ